MFHYCLSRTSNPFKVPQCPICKVCYPSTFQTLANPANLPSLPNPAQHHLKNPAAHPLTPHHHPTRSAIHSAQPLPHPLSPQLSTSPTQKHLSSTSTTPTNQTLPPPQKPLLFTSHHLYLTILLQHLLHLKPPSLTHPPHKPLLPPTSPPTSYPPSPCQIPSPHSTQQTSSTSYSALTSPLDSAPLSDIHTQAHDKKTSNQTTLNPLLSSLCAKSFLDSELLGSFPLLARYPGRYREIYREYEHFYVIYIYGKY